MINAITLINFIKNNLYKWLVLKINPINANLKKNKQCYSLFAYPMYDIFVLSPILVLNPFFVIPENWTPLNSMFLRLYL